MLPALALVVASGAPGWRAAQPEGDGARVIEVVARRYAFEPSTIDVALGEQIRLVVRSADGVHGIRIRRFNVQQVIPRGGDPVAIEFTATAAGRFPILCSEYCGSGHDDMTGVLIVRAGIDMEPAK